jgi:hypothetical protein
MSGPAGKVEGCELCEAARLTTWYHEDDICWVAECEACSVPIVVWNAHGDQPPATEVDHMMGRLSEVATGLFGREEFTIDRVMRQIPDHFHAHARDRRWWQRRSAGMGLWGMEPGLGGIQPGLGGIQPGRPGLSSVDRTSRPGPATGTDR